ncbi:hypothetical protein D3C80_1826840 [compost metagenome]
MLHRLTAEGDEAQRAVEVFVEPAAERVGAGLGVEEAPDLVGLGVVAVVEVGQQVVDGLRLGQLAVAGVQHGGAAVGLLVDQVDDGVADRHGGLVAGNSDAPV